MSALQNEIRRLASKEARRIVRQAVKEALRPVRRHLTACRKDRAELRKQLRGLRGVIKQRSMKTTTVALMDHASDQPKLRFRADGMKSHRAKLGLSAADYGKLVGVSGLTIYHWESKKAKPRRSQLPKIAAIRPLGKRDARAVLAKK